MTNQELRDRIKELNLLPLYIDKEYFLSNGNTYEQKNSDGGTIILLMKENKIGDKYFKFLFHFFFKNTNVSPILELTIKSLFNANKGIENEIEEYFSESTPLAFDLLSFYYEKQASQYNKMILDLLKEDIKEEQQKQKEKEESGEEQGEDEMSSDELQELLEQMDNESRGGQSENSQDDIDLEDFLDEVGDNNAEPDFTENYQDKDLKNSIDEKKEGDGEKDGDGEKSDWEKGDGDDYFLDLEKMKLTEDPISDESLSAFSKYTNTKQKDLKRVFGNKSSVDTILQTMSEEEIESLSRTLNIESSENRAKKINEISTKITQGIQNT
jgi:hypothetical protein